MGTRLAVAGLLLKHRGVLRPLALFCALAAVPIGIWTVIDSREDSGLSDLTDQYAANISIQVQAAVDTRVGVLRVLSERIANDPAYGERNFESSARRRLEELPGLIGLTWVDGTHIVRWGYPKSPAILGMIGKDAWTFPSAPYVKRVSQTGFPAATPPITLMVGGRGFVAAFPGKWDGRHIGSLGAIIGIGDLMRGALGGNPSPNFAVAVMDGNEPLFSFGDVGDGQPHVTTRWVRVLDRQWTVTVSPAPGYVSSHKTPTKFLLLALGLILSAAVALMYNAALDGRRRAEENQRRFQDIAESATDWLWELDADLRCTYVSPQVERVLGVGPEAIIGQKRAELYWPEENPPQVLEAYRSMMAARQPFRDFEFRARDKMGKAVVARLSGVPILDKAGCFAGYRGTGTGITDQVEAKLATQRAEERLHAAMETLPGGFLLYDAESRLVMWNRHLREFYPTAYPHLRVGMTYDDVVDLVVPLHMARSEAERKSLADGWKRSFRSGPQPAELDLSDGRVLQAVNWRSADGSTVCMRFDITDAKRREEQLRSVKSLLYDSIEAVPASFLLWDKNERLIMWNSTVEGMNPTLQGRLRAGLHLEEFVDIVSVDWQASTSEAERLVACQRRLADFRAAPVRSEVRLKDGRIAQVIDWRSINNATVSLSFDITDARRREEELRHAQRMEAVGQMTGGIAHDFNNLLTVIIGYGEFLRLGTNLSEKDRESLNHVLGAAMRGSSLIQRLMMFSRTQPMQIAAVRPNQLISELAPLLERTLGETIELVCSLDPAAGTIASDRGQLESALMNLAINARDAMTHGGKLTIVTRRAPGQTHAGPDVDGVEIMVTDTGVGMSEETARRAFDPFFTTKGVGKGTGLGLSMVYSFAQAANGRVTIQSAPGMGTAVSLWLPEGGGPAEQTAVESKGADVKEFGRGRRILIVEDDPDVAGYAQETISSLGFRASLARSAMEAQGLLENHGPWDLLFTDVVLPGGMSGPELASWARKRVSALPVLFTTGYLPDQSDASDVQPLLRKPYRKTELAQELAHALGAED